MTLTLEDHAAMQGEGWGIFPTFDGFRLARFGANSRFRDDEAAWIHVAERAEEGDPIAARAIEFLKSFDHLELACIARYVAIFRPSQVSFLREAA